MQRALYEKEDNKVFCEVLISLGKTLVHKGEFPKRHRNKSSGVESNWRCKKGWCQWWTISDLITGNLSDNKKRWHIFQTV